MTKHVFRFLRQRSDCDVVYLGCGYMEWPGRKSFSWSTADLAIRMNLHPFIGKDDSHDLLIVAVYSAAMKAWPKFLRLMS